jgi:hypothetical protein
MELLILAVLPMPHCQIFHAFLAIMMKTDTRLLRFSFRRHSQTLFFPKHSGYSRKPVYFVLVMNMSRTSCCQTDSPISVSHYWFPCSKKETHARDNSCPFTHLCCFSVARDVSTWNLLTSVLCHGIATQNSARRSIHSVQT